MNFLRLGKSSKRLKKKWLGKNKIKIRKYLIKMFIKVVYWKDNCNPTHFIFRWILGGLVRKGLSSPKVRGSRASVGLNMPPLH